MMVLTSYNVDNHIFSGLMVKWVVGIDGIEIDKIEINNINIHENKLSIFIEVSRKLYRRLFFSLIQKYKQIGE